jgi:hypothetical protein
MDFVGPPLVGVPRLEDGPATSAGPTVQKPKGRWQEILIF